MEVTRENLNSIMEFEHVIEVHADGSVTEPSGVWAPELNDGEITELNSDWLLLDGWSGQYLYSGSIMHPSEYIGGPLADWMLDTPGLYVALVAETYRSCGDQCGQCKECEPEFDGWVIAYIDKSNN